MQGSTRRVTKLEITLLLFSLHTHSLKIPLKEETTLESSTYDQTTMWSYMRARHLGRQGSWHRIRGSELLK
jgi:hypothetical protein